MLPSSLSCSLFFSLRSDFVRLLSSRCPRTATCSAPRVCATPLGRGACLVVACAVAHASYLAPCSSCTSSACPSPASVATCASDGSWRVAGDLAASALTTSLGCVLVVNGSFSVPMGSTLQLKSCALVSSVGCVTLQGSLIVDVRDQSLSSASELTLLEYGCGSGQFSGVTFVGIPSGVDLQGQVTYEPNRVVARFTGSGVTPGPNTFAPVPSPLPPPSNGTVDVNCAVGSWTGWESCSDGSPCGSVSRTGTQCMHRLVMVQPQGAGAPCPELRRCRSCTIPACNCGVQCHNGGMCSSGNTCSCIGGYTGNDCNTPINYCSSNSDDCVGAATCVYTGPGTFNCTCPAGTFGNGRLGSCALCGCQPVNPCLDGTADCDSDANCAQTSTAPYYDCFCPAGYRGTGHGVPNGCVPINPCNDTQFPHNCHSLATCHFTGPNQHICTCPPGYLGNGYGTNGCYLPCWGTCATPNVCPSPHTSATCAGNGMWEVGAVGQNTTFTEVVACKTRVLGNLDVLRGTTLSLKGCASIQVDGCVVLDGFLDLDMSDYPPITPSTDHVLINSTCVSGAFRATSTSGVRGLLSSFVAVPSVTPTGVKITFTLIDPSIPAPSTATTSSPATTGSTTAPTTASTTAPGPSTSSATTSSVPPPTSPTTAPSTTTVTSAGTSSPPVTTTPVTTGPNPNPTTTGPAPPTTTGPNPNPTTTAPGPSTVGSTTNPPGPTTTSTTANPNPNPNSPPSTTSIPVTSDAGSRAVALGALFAAVALALVHAC